MCTSMGIQMHSMYVRVHVYMYGHVYAYVHTMYMCSDGCSSVSHPTLPLPGS